MSQSIQAWRERTIVVAAILVFGVAALIGGPGLSIDVDIISSATAARIHAVGLTDRAIMLTQLGSANGLIAILFLASAFLGLKRRWHDLMTLTGIVITGRVLIELLKLAIDRPRPTLTLHPVEVHSLSFPSAHAGNSMITFLAIALIAVPAYWRGRAIGLALVASLAIGATRPLLGVHWPSDVIGGWAFGIGWAVAMTALTRRWRLSAE